MNLDISQYIRERTEAPGALEWLLDLDHLSASSLSMLRRCPYQFQQRYIRGIKARPAEAPVVGSAIHAGLERNFRQKISSHVDEPIASLLDWYMDEGFEATVAEQEVDAGIEVKWDTDTERARDRGKLMLGEYHSSVAPRIQPEGVEERIEIDLGAPVPVVGYYDIVREASVIDVKTGKRKDTTPREDWRIQALVYGESQGKPVEFHSVSAAIRKDGSAGPVNIVTPLESEAMLVDPTPAERAQMRHSIRAIAAEANFYMGLYGPEEDWPTHGRFHSWACSYCGYRPWCPAWEDEQ